MPKKQATSMLRRVWIELERPINERHRNEIMERANNMLQRLSPHTAYRFAWSESRSMWMYGNPMGYTYLNDSGTWLSLDWVGRPLTEQELALPADH